MAQSSPETEIGTILDGSKRGAIFSENSEYRYALWRTWDEEKPTLAFIALNPSTADAEDDDPTVSSCVRFAKDWGFGGMIIGNLFAVCATDPRKMKSHPDPVGPKNDQYLKKIVDEADKVVAAWGGDGTHYDRCSEVIELLNTDLFALTTTKNGQPGHPLRKSKDLQPDLWKSNVAASDKS